MLNLNDHVKEIVGMYVDEDLRRREVQFPADLADFRQEQAREQVIALGDGKYVKVSAANFEHLCQHHINQWQKAKEAQAAAEITNQVMESEVGQMLYEHPHWTFAEAMRRLGYWQ